jgi:hypothetical protein
VIKKSFYGLRNSGIRLHENLAYTFRCFVLDSSLVMQVQMYRLRIVVGTMSRYAHMSMVSCALCKTHKYYLM